MTGQFYTGRLWSSPFEVQQLIYRSWYYVRLGYGTYLASIVGIFGTLVSVYYLAIKSALIWSRCSRISTHFREKSEEYGYKLEDND